MRVAYQIPSVDQFGLIFNKAPLIRGGALRDIKYYSPPTVYGGGLISTIGHVIKRTLPFLTNLFLPTLSNVGINLAKDYSSGRNMRDSIKSRGKEAFGEIKHKIQRGGARAKKKKVEKD